MKMMERKAYTTFGETRFGETGRHPLWILRGKVSQTQTKQQRSHFSGDPGIMASNPTIL